MLIDYPQLKVGDEVIISKNSYLKYIKILALPKKDGSNFKCSCRIKEEYPATYGGTTPLIPSIQKTYPFDITLHNSHYYQDFRYRDIYLVKREDF